MLSRVVFAVAGTWGDLFPVVGLATELTKRGHAVTIATSAWYRPIVEEAGVGFARAGRDTGPAALAAHPDALTTRRGGLVALRKLCEDFLFPQFDELVDDLRAAVRGADLFVAHPIQLGSPLAAEIEGVRLATACVTPPWIPSRVVAPAGAMPLFGGGDAALSWDRTIKAIDKVVDGPVNQVRTRLGLPTHEHIFFDTLYQAEAVLVMSSPAVFPAAPDWPSHVSMTGCVTWDRAGLTEPDPRLEAFLSAGRPPVVVTMGGSASLDPQGLYERLAGAIVAAGARAILLTGPLPSPLEFDHPDVCIAPFAPSSTLFPRCRMVIHHGGAGTVLTALEAGKPQLSMPRAFDQMWAAQRFADLGAGLVIPWKQAVSGDVYGPVAEVLGNPRYERAAEQVAEVMAGEDGLTTAVARVEQLLAI
jgi:rhamnosyltransferase subunit B